MQRNMQNRRSGQPLGKAARSGCPGATLLALGWSWVAPPAEAQSLPQTPPQSVFFSIRREAGSLSCADSDTFWKKLRALAPESRLVFSSTVATADYIVNVKVGPQGSGHTAFLDILGPSSGAREIHDKDQDCGGLAEAMAIAVLMVADPTWKSPIPAAPPQSTDGTPRTDLEPGAGTHRPSAPPPLPPKIRALPLGLSLSRSYGITEAPSWGIALEGGLRHPSGWAAHLRGLRLFPSTVTVTRGTLSVGVTGVIFGPCYRVESGSWGILPCLDLGIGIQHGDASGFHPLSDHASRAWLVLGPSVTLDAPLAGALRWMFSASSLVAPRPERFEVLGAGSQTQGRLGLSLFAGAAVQL